MSDTNEAKQSVELLDTVLKRIGGLGEGTSRLFRGGINGIDIEVATSAADGCRISVKVNGPEGPRMAGLAALGAEGGGMRLAFGPIGHRTIAVIAQQDLQQRRPDVAGKLQDIIDADPSHRDLAGLATYPDDIRNSQPATKPYHFVDIPFDESSNADPVPPDGPTVLTKLFDYRNVLRTSTDRQERADALAWVIHLTGDIHQPLHCITRVTADHPLPDGDRGGNLFTLHGHYRNLHSLWDDSPNIDLPGDPRIADENILANKIAQEYPRTSLTTELAQTGLSQWALASYNLAKQYAYALDEGSVPSPDYLHTAKTIGQEQAALAGYRLADTLIDVLGS